MILNKVNFDNFHEAIRIQNEIFPHENGTLNILASLDKELFEKRTNMKYSEDKPTYYLAEVDGNLIGITGIYYYNNEEAWLGWFGILPKYRKYGFGKELLNITIELAKEKGFKTLRLYTDKNENAEAIKLYEKMGFVGEKYSAEELAYDCYIYSITLCEQKVELWNNKIIGLSYQSKLDQMKKEDIQKIIELYEVD